MNGIDPPTPADIGGRPKCAVEADAATRRATRRAAARPSPGWASTARTGLAPRMADPSRKAARAAAPRRARRASAGCGGRPSPPSAAGARCPASAMGGSPSAPVIASAGRQVWARTSSTGSACTVRMPGRSGTRVTRSSPITAATFRACCTRSGGISTWKSRGRISPLASSSRRERSWRRIRKLEGTIPVRARMDPLGEDVHRQDSRRRGPGATWPSRAGRSCRSEASRQTTRAGSPMRDAKAST